MVRRKGWAAGTVNHQDVRTAAIHDWTWPQEVFSWQESRKQVVTLRVASADAYVEVDCFMEGASTYTSGCSSERSCRYQTASVRVANWEGVPRRLVAQDGIKRCKPACSGMFSNTQKKRN